MATIKIRPRENFVQNKNLFLDEMELILEKGALKSSHPSHECDGKG